MATTIDLSGRVALVCGSGGGGIGEAMSRLLAEAGADIVAVDRSQELVDETRAMAEKLGRTCHGIVADLTDIAVRDQVVERARTLAGRIHLLANIAGGSKATQWGPVLGAPNEVFQEVMALNYDYVFAICRDAARVMTEQGEGGAIVNVASVSALPSAPMHGAYGAAKAAVIALSRTLAVELAPARIRVNVVAPGRTNTRRSFALRGGAAEVDDSPLGRRVEPAEVAQGILFLLSDLASGITGQLLAVDGGLTAQSVLGGRETFASRSRW